MEQEGVELGVEHHNGVESQVSTLELELPWTDGNAQLTLEMSSNILVILEISNHQLVVEQT